MLHQLAHMSSVVGLIAVVKHADGTLELGKANLLLSDVALAAAMVEQDVLRELGKQTD